MIDFPHGLDAEQWFTGKVRRFDRRIRLLYRLGFRQQFIPDIPELGAVFVRYRHDRKQAIAGTTVMDANRTDWQLKLYRLLTVSPLQQTRVGVGRGGKPAVIDHGFDPSESTSIETQCAELIPEVQETR
jgi:hypothetical protein